MKAKQLYKKVKYKIDENIFIGAAEKTFAKRDFDISSSESLEILRDSSLLKTRWNSYAKSHSFAKDVDFEETIDC